MFCENCGKELKAGSKFCDQCGSKIEIMNEKEREMEIRRLVSVLKLIILKKESEQKYTEEIGADKTDTLILLKKFGEHLKKEQEIPEELPKEPDSVLGFKDILSIFFDGVVITAIITPISGVEATFWNLLECAAFFWAIIGYFTYHKRKAQYDEYREKIAEKREKMLNGEGFSKYKHEDRILNLINKNYKLYIGTPIFHSSAIRNQNKSRFQTEIEDITKFAEENKMDNSTLSDIVEKFYRGRHHSKIAELQNDMKKLKEKFLELKSEFEAMEIKTSIDQSLEIAGKLLDFAPEDISIPVEDYDTAMKKISSEIENTEQELEKEKKAREKALESLMNNIPVYKKTLIEISLKRAKYPDDQLSSSFVKSFDSKTNELLNNLPSYLGNAENKAVEIESEIKNGIVCLTDMLEAELDSRHERIYGKQKNKLAAKFKSIYK